MKGLFRTGTCLHFLLQKPFIIFSFYWITQKILESLSNLSLSNSSLIRARFGPCQKISVLN